VGLSEFFRRGMHLDGHRPIKGNGCTHSPLRVSFWAILGSCHHVSICLAGHYANLTPPFVVAQLRGDSKITGTVTFEQSSESSPTTVSWNITGNDANAERGMHVHQFGDNTNGCTSAGPHCKQSEFTRNDPNHEPMN
jgi:Cu/Zn superoxide dismutase